MKIQYKSFRSKISIVSASGILMIFVFLQSSCSIRLAPMADQAILNNLNNSSKEIMNLLASITDGTDTIQFKTRLDKYNSIIGGIDALKIQLQSRPMPDSKVLNKIIEKVNENLKKRNISEMVTDEYASIGALNKISANILKMQDTDKRKGLTSQEVKIFKGFVILYLDQASTFENYLKR